MTPRELLEQLNELDEHTHIEAKTAGEIGMPPKHVTEADVVDATTRGDAGVSSTCELYRS